MFIFVRYQIANCLAKLMCLNNLSGKLFTLLPFNGFLVVVGNIEVVTVGGVTKGLHSF